MGLGRMTTLLVTLALTDLAASQCDNVILEEPDPVLEPLGTQLELSCSVDMAFRTAWRIILPGSPAVTIDRYREVAFAILANHSIVTEVSSAENREPPLRIIGTIGNSGTTVQCRAVQLDNRFEERVCPGTVVQMTFHGPPLAPENLTATADGLGSLQISWSLDNAHNVSVDFVVNATNVADSSERFVMRTSQLNSVIPFSDNTSCNNYSIQVVANNSAGQGPPSDIIIRSVPSLPEISAVEESLQHTLRRTSSGVTLDVTLNDVTACPEYPVLNYTLVVEDSEGNRTTQTSQTTGDIVNITISGLMENTRYSYYVLATNRFGDSNSSSPVEIITTDVQNVDICLLGGNTYAINCVFLDGSNTSCFYSLRAGVNIFSGTIDRSISEGDTIMVADIDGSQLLAYASDLILEDADDLAVRRHITSGSVLPCPVSTTNLPTSPATDLIIGVTLPALLMLIVAVIILIAYCYKKGSRGTFRVNEDQENHSASDGDKGALRLELPLPLPLPLSPPPSPPLCSPLDRSSCRPNNTDQL